MCLIYQETRKHHTNFEEKLKSWSTQETGVRGAVALSSVNLGGICNIFFFCLASKIDSKLLFKSNRLLIL